MPRISQLTEATSVSTTDDFVIRTSSGTRKVRKSNIWPSINEFTTLTDGGVNINGDHIWIWDSTDGVAKRILVSDFVFGNFGNLAKEDDFTIDPGTDNLQPLECRGTWATSVITLDGSTDIGGCAFIILNYTTADITLNNVNGVSLHLDDGSVGTGTVRPKRAASVNVNNGGTIAIFSGG